MKTAARQLQTSSVSTLAADLHSDDEDFNSFKLTDEDYREMVDEMTFAEVVCACDEEGISEAQTCSEEEARDTLLSWFCTRAILQTSSVSTLAADLHSGADDGPSDEMDADDYREMVDEMTEEESKMACVEEGIPLEVWWSVDDMKEALCACYCVVPGTLPHVSSNAVNVNNVQVQGPMGVKDGSMEDDMDAEDYREMVDEMTIEEVISACEEEGVALNDVDSVDENGMRMALFLHYS